MVDPKGEYSDLAAASGVRPVALRPGAPSVSTHSTRGPVTGAEWTAREARARARQLELLSSRASACSDAACCRVSACRFGCGVAVGDRTGRRADRALGRRGAARPHRGVGGVIAHRAARAVGRWPRRGTRASTSRARGSVRDVRWSDDIGPGPFRSAGRTRPLRPLHLGPLGILMAVPPTAWLQAALALEPHHRPGERP